MLQSLDREPTTTATGATDATTDQASDTTTDASAPAPSPTDTTQASPETASTTAPPDKSADKAADPNASTAPPDGVTVDEQGRWRTADGKFASKQPSAEALQSAKAEVAAKPELAPLAPQAVAAEPAPVQNVPWTPNIYGKEVPLIEGALYKPGHGLFVPESALPQLVPLVARGTKWDEVKQARQGMAQEKQTYEGKLALIQEQHNAILDATIYNDQWMELARTNPGLASTQLKMLQDSAALDMREKFGHSAQTTPKAPNAPQTEAAELDPYDADRAFLAVIADEVQSLDEHKVLTPADQRSLAQYLKDHKADTWEWRDGDHRLDMAPIRMAIDVFVERATRAKAEANRPKVETAGRRNAAAVPTTTAPAAPAHAKPANTPAKPDYSDRPWEDPSRDFSERRDLWKQHMKLPT